MTHNVPRQDSHGIRTASENLPAVSPEEDASRHAPVLDRMLELIRRGQQSGDLDNTLPPDWLLTASLAVGRAAQDEVKAGRMTVEEASRVVHKSFIRLLGIEGPGSGHGRRQAARMPNCS